MMLATAATIASSPAAHLTDTLRGLLAPGALVHAEAESPLLHVLTMGNRRSLALVISDEHKVLYNVVVDVRVILKRSCFGKVCVPSFLFFVCAL